MTQTILDFDLATTNERLISRACTIILGEYIKGLGLEKLCNRNLPSLVFFYLLKQKELHEIHTVNTYKKISYLNFDK